MLLVASDTIIIEPGYSKTHAYPASRWDDAIRAYVLRVIKYPLGHHRYMKEDMPAPRLVFPYITMEMSINGGDYSFTYTQTPISPSHKTARGVNKYDVVICSAKRIEAEWGLLRFACDRNISHLEIKNDFQRKGIVLVKDYSEKNQLGVYYST
jgi:hypothetical protein